MNPNVVMLKDNIPTCPICLGFLNNPIKSTNCSHLFCDLCLHMWLQKKSQCPICRKTIDKTISIYFPNNDIIVNNKLNHLFNSIQNLKLDNYGKLIFKCLVCGKIEPKEQLMVCNLCNYFQSHVFCDPPLGLTFGKYYCGFCRRKFIESLKNK